MSDETEWTLVDAFGFTELIGPFYVAPFRDRIGRFKFTSEPKHRNRANLVHGGMLTAFADRALGSTARQDDPNRAQATVQLDVHFIKAVRIGETVEIECRVLRETRSLVFVDGSLTVDGELVATATGVWKVIAKSVAANTAHDASAD